MTYGFIELCDVFAFVARRDAFLLLPGGGPDWNVGNLLACNLPAKDTILLFSEYIITSCRRTARQVSFIITLVELPKSMRAVLMERQTQMCEPE
jgi:hypothetical protein